MRLDLTHRTAAFFYFGDPERGSIDWTEFTEFDPDTLIVAWHEVIEAWFVEVGMPRPEAFPVILCTPTGRCLLTACEIEFSCAQEEVLFRMRWL